ncbi:hypothetical protein BDF20DRAFT_835839 [Mycotypha africana]|uniref:uncharacterized protein n=1 Tax=Mycotypha africana TaxID=64632 RepID=UPI0023010CB1|nr:uncharacterized protein BDF20DRAFT_835839 [Mycotypha africana]KAI8977003.1 hypothetical protein BDF20DRAFT_835839 [Mycotypha africana]
MSRPRKQQQKYHLGRISKTSSTSPTSIDDNSTSDADDHSSSNSDIIRCVCDDSSDDGFMIQCELCDEWQHGHCVNIRKSNVPKHYYCYRCARNFNHPTGMAKRRRAVFNGDAAGADNKGKKRFVKRDKVKSLVLKKKRNDSDNDSSDNNSKSGSDIDENEAVASKSGKLTATKRKKKFTFLRKSIFKEKLVEDLLMEVHRQWMELNKSIRHGGLTGVGIPTSSTKGLNSIVVMESNLLTPAIPKTSVRPLRKALRGSYFQQQQREQKIHQNPVAKGIFADIHIPEKRYLMEVTGELIRKSEYKKDVDNHYALLGTPLPRVFFYQALDICINARFAGNDARYIRRSCCPNAEIKSIILPNDSDDQTIHMGIYTSDEVNRGEEITIGWNWHKGVLMWQKNREFLRRNYRVNIEKSERKAIREILDFIQDKFGECACEDKDECLIESLKDQLEDMDDSKDGEIDEFKQDKISDSEEKPQKLTGTTQSIANKQQQQQPSQRSLKRSTPPVIRKPPKKPTHIHTTTKKETRATDIFSSSDESNTPTWTTTTTLATFNTATLTNDTMDTDINPGSPLTSFSNIASEVVVKEDAAFKSGTDTIVNTSNTMARLPCKKRWLLHYLAEKKRIKTSTTQQQLSPVVHNDIPPTDSSESMIIPVTDNTSNNLSDVGELSDGTSSESTLPLEDTPTSRHLEFNTKQSHGNTTTTTTATATQTASASTVNNTTTITSIMATTTNNTSALDASEIIHQEAITAERVSIATDDHDHVLSNGNSNRINSMVETRTTESDSTTTSTQQPVVAKQAPKKLTLQEYLSMRQAKFSPASTNVEGK